MPAPITGRPDTNEFDDHDKGERLAQFKAYVRGGKINQHGEFVFTVAVPYEDKYRAMPITDIRGTMFVMEVWSPEGIVTGAALKRLLEIEEILDDKGDPVEDGALLQFISKDPEGDDNVTFNLKPVPDLPFDPFELEDDDG